MRTKDFIAILYAAALSVAILCPPPPAAGGTIVIRKGSFAGGVPTFGFNSRSFTGATPHYINILSNVSSTHDYSGLSDAITITAWVKLSSRIIASNGTWTQNNTVIELRDTGTAAGTSVPFAFGFYQGWISCGFSDDYTTGSEKVSYNLVQPLNTWMHIAVTVNGDAVELFKDGSSIETGTLTIAAGDRSTSGGANDYMQIGIRSRDGGQLDTNPFDGLIADVRLYDAVLSGATITSIYGGAHESTNLIGWWLTDNDDVLDYSTNSNNGTNSGSTYSTDGPLD